MRGFSALYSCARSSVNVVCLFLRINSQPENRILPNTSKLILICTSDLLKKLQHLCCTDQNLLPSYMIYHNANVIKKHMMRNQIRRLCQYAAFLPIIPKNYLKKHLGIRFNLRIPLSATFFNDTPTQFGGTVKTNAESKNS